MLIWALLPAATFILRRDMNVSDHQTPVVIHGGDVHGQEKVDALQQLGFWHADEWKKQMGQAAIRMVIGMPPSVPSFPHLLLMQALRSCWHLFVMQHVDKQPRLRMPCSTSDIQICKGQC